MKKFIYGFLLSLFLASQCQAGLVSIYETYATNGQVTAANLNGNINNIVSVVNGGIDNNNVNTTTYRLLEILGSLPSASIAGRTVFLTTDSSLNFDSGSTWTKAITAAGTAVQGDMLYYSGTAWTRLGYGTTGYPLTTNGNGANPSYSVLSIAAGGTGTTTAALAYNAIAALGAWVDKSASYAAQQATTDGFVIAGTTDDTSDLAGYSDANANPTTLRAEAYGAGRKSITFLVKKNDYWKIITGGTIQQIYWIPMGN